MLLAALAALVYVGASITLDSRRLGAGVSGLGLLGCGAVLGLSLLNYLLRFHRWQLMVARLGHRLPAGRHLIYYLSGFAFTVSPAKAGEAVRSLYLREHGVPYSDSLAALFAERALDVVAIIALATLVIAGRRAYLPLVIAVPAMLAVLTVLVSRKTLPDWLRRCADRLSYRPAARLLSAAAALLVSTRALLRPGLLMLGALIGIVSWGAEGVGLHLICGALHISVGPVTAIGIYGLAVLAGNATFFLPAGIGGMEVAMTALLVTQGAAPQSAIAATLLCRVATLWFAVVLGIVAAMGLELRVGPVPMRAAP
jgi:glycosyltransferase 2 family protein